MSVAAGRLGLEEGAVLNRRAALASTAVALLLGGLKLAGVRESGSVALWGSLADTTLDLVASLATFAAVRWAGQPADAEHRFGHGKAEALAALFQAGLMLAAAAGVALVAIVRLGSGEAPTAPVVGVAVSTVAIGATVALVAYQRSVLRRTGSVAIAADHLHYQSDLWLNAAVIAALLLEAWAGIVGADAVFGIGIAAWLAWSATRAGGGAVDMLMDREWPEADRAHVVQVAAATPGVLGVHDLRTRVAGSTGFVQFHIWVDPAISVAAAHDIVDAAEDRVRAASPGAQVLIHVDPFGHRDREEAW